MSAVISSVPYVANELFWMNIMKNPYWFTFRQCEAIHLCESPTPQTITELSGNSQSCFSVHILSTRNLAYGLRSPYVPWFSVVYGRHSTISPGLIVLIGFTTCLQSANRSTLDTKRIDYVPAYPEEDTSRHNRHTHSTVYPQKLLRYHPAMQSAVSRHHSRKSV